jgi:guanine deaminase
LRGAGELAAKYPDVWIQSHVAENRDEIKWARELFPGSRSYLATYDDFGLMRERAIYAHCIHFDDDDRALMRETGAAAAVSPTSNLFLGSGFFDYAGADRVGFATGWPAMWAAAPVSARFIRCWPPITWGARADQATGLSLSPQAAVVAAHGGGSSRLGALEGVVGNLQVGCEADFVVLNPAGHAAAGAHRPGGQSG